MGRILRGLRRLPSLPRARRRLLLRAAWLVFVVRLSLRLLPARAILRRADARSRRGAGPRREGIAVRDVVWAVEVVSRRSPGSTCLVQALAAQLLLARYGHPSLLQIGVARPDQGMLKAHAWLEHEGTVLIGDLNLHEYTRMPNLREAL